MSRELEGLLYFGIMGIVLLFSALFVVLMLRKTTNVKKIYWQSVGLSFLLFTIACIWWFFQASDGFSLIFGLAYYGGAFVLGALLNFLTVAFVKRKFSR